MKEAGREIFFAEFLISSLYLEHRKYQNDYGLSSLFLAPFCPPLFFLLLFALMAQVIIDVTIFGFG
jgi:hypothetical protein